MLPLVIIKQIFLACCMWDWLCYVVVVFLSVVETNYAFPC